MLRNKNTAGLSPAQKENRFRMLDLLDEYRKAGLFPRNYDHKKRKPCFIDKNGRICAVGYLVEKTAGRIVAEEISSKFKYADIYEMNDPVIDEWIASSGLSREECAMIQPAYGGYPPGSDNTNSTTISKGYAVSSSVLGGVSLTANTLNAVQIARGTNSRGIALVGLFTGATQLVLGLSEFPETTYSWNGPQTNEKEKTLSMINIGLGTTTMLLSTWNLISKKKPKEKKVAWGLTAFEFNNRPGMAFMLTRKL